MKKYLLYLLFLAIVGGMPDNGYAMEDSSVSDTNSNEYYDAESGSFENSENRQEVPVVVIPTEPLVVQGRDSDNENQKIMKEQLQDLLSVSCCKIIFTDLYTRMGYLEEWICKKNELKNQRIELFLTNCKSINALKNKIESENFSVKKAIYCYKKLINKCLDACNSVNEYLVNSGYEKFVASTERPPIDQKDEEEFAVSFNQIAGISNGPTEMSNEEIVIKSNEEIVIKDEFLMFLSDLHRAVKGETDQEDPNKNRKIKIKKDAVREVELVNTKGEKEKRTYQVAAVIFNEQDEKQAYLKPYVGPNAENNRADEPGYFDTLLENNPDADLDWTDRFYRAVNNLLHENRAFEKCLEKCGGRKSGIFELKDITDYLIGASRESLEPKSFDQTKKLSDRERRELYQKRLESCDQAKKFLYQAVFTELWNELKDTTDQAKREINNIKEKLLKEENAEEIERLTQSLKKQEKIVDKTVDVLLSNKKFLKTFPQFRNIKKVIKELTDVEPLATIVFQADDLAGITTIKQFQEKIKEKMASQNKKGAYFDDEAYVSSYFQKIKANKEPISIPMYENKVKTEDAKEKLKIELDDLRTKYDHAFELFIERVKSALPVSYIVLTGKEEIEHINTIEDLKTKIAQKIGRPINSNIGENDFFNKYLQKIIELQNAFTAYEAASAKEKEKLSDPHDEKIEIKIYQEPFFDTLTYFDVSYNNLIKKEEQEVQQCINDIKAAVKNGYAGYEGFSIDTIEEEEKEQLINKRPTGVRLKETHEELVVGYEAKKLYEQQIGAIRKKCAAEKKIVNEYFLTKLLEWLSDGQYQNKNTAERLAIAKIVNALQKEISQDKENLDKNISSQMLSDEDRRLLNDIQHKIGYVERSFLLDIDNEDKNPILKTEKEVDYLKEWHAYLENFFEKNKLLSVEDVKKTVPVLIYEQDDQDPKLTKEKILIDGIPLKPLYVEEKIAAQVVGHIDSIKVQTIIDGYQRFLDMHQKPQFTLLSDLYKKTISLLQKPSEAVENLSKIQTAIVLAACVKNQHSLVFKDIQKWIDIFKTIQTLHNDQSSFLHEPVLKMGCAEWIKRCSNINEVSNIIVEFNKEYKKDTCATIKKDYKIDTTEDGQEKEINLTTFAAIVDAIETKWDVESKKHIKNIFLHGGCPSEKKEVNDLFVGLAGLLPLISEKYIDQSQPFPLVDTRSTGKNKDRAIVALMLYVEQDMPEKHKAILGKKIRELRRSASGDHALAEIQRLDARRLITESETIVQRVRGYMPSIFSGLTRQEQADADLFKAQLKRFFNLIYHPCKSTGNQNKSPEGICIQELTEIRQHEQDPFIKEKDARAYAFKFLQQGKGYTEIVDIFKRYDRYKQKFKEFVNTAKKDQFKADQKLSFENWFTVYSSVEQRLAIIKKDPSFHAIVQEEVLLQAHHLPGWFEKHAAGFVPDDIQHRIAAIENAQQVIKGAVEGIVVDENKVLDDAFNAVQAMQVVDFKETTIADAWHAYYESKKIKNDSSVGLESHTIIFSFAYYIQAKKKIISFEDAHLLAQIHTALYAATHEPAGYGGSKKIYDSCFARWRSFLLQKGLEESTADQYILMKKNELEDSQTYARSLYKAIVYDIQNEEINKTVASYLKIMEHRYEVELLLKASLDAYNNQLADKSFLLTKHDKAKMLKEALAEYCNGKNQLSFEQKIEKIKIALYSYGQEKAVKLHSEMVEEYTHFILKSEPFAKKMTFAQWRQFSTEIANTVYQKAATIDYVDLLSIMLHFPTLVLAGKGNLQETAELLKRQSVDCLQYLAIFYSQGIEESSNNKEQQSGRKKRYRWHSCTQLAEKKLIKPVSVEDYINQYNTVKRELFPVPILESFNIDHLDDESTVSLKMNRQQLTHKVVQMKMRGLSDRDYEAIRESLHNNNTDAKQTVHDLASFADLFNEVCTKQIAGGSWNQEICAVEPLYEQWQNRLNTIMEPIHIDNSTLKSEYKKQYCVPLVSYILKKQLLEQRLSEKQRQLIQPLFVPHHNSMMTALQKPDEDKQGSPEQPDEKQQWFKPGNNFETSLSKYKTVLMSCVYAYQMDKIITARSISKDQFWQDLVTVQHTINNSVPALDQTWTLYTIVICYKRFLKQAKYVPFMQNAPFALFAARLRQAFDATVHLPTDERWTMIQPLVRLHWFEKIGNQDKLSIAEFNKQYPELYAMERKVVDRYKKFALVPLLQEINPLLHYLVAELATYEDIRQLVGYGRERSYIPHHRVNVKEVATDEKTQTLWAAHLGRTFFS